MNEILDNRIVGEREEKKEWKKKQESQLVWTRVENEKEKVV